LRESLCPKYYVYRCGNGLGKVGLADASPHVAAVAAYLAATQGLVGPGEIETAVRNAMYTANRIDNGGHLIRYPQIP
jgi:hypothetical protein